MPPNSIAFRVAVATLEVAIYAKLHAIFLAVNGPDSLPRVLGYLFIAVLAGLRCVQLAWIYFGGEEVVKAPSPTAIAAVDDTTSPHPPLSVADAAGPSTTSALAPTEATLPPADAAAFISALSNRPRVVPRFVPYERLTPAGLKQFAPVTTTLGYSLPQVVAAMAAKYTLGPHRSAADRLQPAVTSIEDVRRETVHLAASGGGGAVHLHSQRIVTGLDDLPSMLRRFAGVDALHSLIDTELHAEAGTMFCVSRNANLQSLGRFQEAAVYEVHPADARYTRYTSRVEVSATTWMGGRVVGLLGDDGAAMIAAHVDLLRARLAEAEGPELPPLPADAR